MSDCILNSGLSTTLGPRLCCTCPAMRTMLGNLQVKYCNRPLPCASCIDINRRSLMQFLHVFPLTALECLQHCGSSAPEQSVFNVRAVHGIRNNKRLQQPHQGLIMHHAMNTSELFARLVFVLRLQVQVLHRTPQRFTQSLISLPFKFCIFPTAENKTIQFVFNFHFIFVRNEIVSLSYTVLYERTCRNVYTPICTLCLC